MAAGVRDLKEKLKKSEEGRLKLQDKVNQLTEENAKLQSKVLQVNSQWDRALQLSNYYGRLFLVTFFVIGFIIGMIIAENM